MNFYETMYIVHPILEMGRLHDLIMEIEKMINEKGGEGVYTKVIGKKRLAYPISKQKFGNYVLVQFKSDGSSNSDFNINLEHNPNILRNMIISIKESDVNNQTEDIIDQISGLTRPSSVSTEGIEKEIIEKNETKNDEPKLNNNPDEIIEKEADSAEQKVKATEPVKE